MSAPTLLELIWEKRLVALSSNGFSMIYKKQQYMDRIVSKKNWLLANSRSEKVLRTRAYETVSL